MLRDDHAHYFISKNAFMYGMTTKGKYSRPRLKLNNVLFIAKGSEECWNLRYLSKALMNAKSKRPQFEVFCVSLL